MISSSLPIVCAPTSRTLSTLLFLSYRKPLTYGKRFKMLKALILKHLVTLVSVLGLLSTLVFRAFSRSKGQNSEYSLGGRLLLLAGLDYAGRGRGNLILVIPHVYRTSPPLWHHQQQVCNASYQHR